MTWREWRKYPQTGIYLIPLKGSAPRLLRAIQWVCKKTIGHEWSETESCTAGPNHIAKWCRWCDFYAVIPREELPGTAARLDAIRADFEDQLLDEQ